MATPRLENYARQSVFDALAALFIRPDAAGVLERWADAVKVTAALAGEVGMPTATLDALREKPLPTAEAVQAEYETLFGDGGPVSLLESDWPKTGEDPRGTCRLEYLKADLAVTDELGVPEDHLGMLCGFMAVLLLREDPDAAERFFDRHPGKWLPALVEAIRGRSEAVFFRDAATLLETICEIEASLREAKNY